MENTCTEHESTCLRLLYSTTVMTGSMSGFDGGSTVLDLLVIAIFSTCIKVNAQVLFSTIVNAAPLKPKEWNNRMLNCKGHEFKCIMVWNNTGLDTIVR